MSATLATAERQGFFPDQEVVPFEQPPPERPPRPEPAEVAAPEAVSGARSPRETAYRISAVLLMGDFLAACFAIFLGLELREWQRTGALFTMENRELLTTDLPYWVLGGALLFTWLMITGRTYEVANLYRMQQWMKNLARTLILWSIALWACIGLFQITNFTPRVGVVYCVLTLAATLTIWRLAAFVFIMQPRVKEAASTRVIVVGWNAKATHLRRAMRRDLAQLSEIIGCVPLPGGRFATRPPPELAVLGDYSDLPRIIRSCGANSIILADVSCPSREIQDLIAFCQREMIGFKLVPEYFPALNSGLQIQALSGVPLLGVSELPLERTLNRTVKRLVDILGGVTGFLLSAPLIGFFGLWVYCESPGPIIYRQRRTSRSGRVFQIYKIRSMRMNAESESGAVWCKRDDPRRLRIGTFMRKYNIDELPQFWNVIKGDMSLVGPRPERPELIEKFKDEIPNYNARHEVRTGLTGWAQIHGLRGDTDLGKRVEADLYYMENWSLFLDLYCLFATVFNNKNAH